MIVTVTVTEAVTVTVTVTVTISACKDCSVPWLDIACIHECT